MKVHTCPADLAAADRSGYKREKRLQVREEMGVIEMISGYERREAVTSEEMGVIEMRSGYERREAVKREEMGVIEMRSGY